MVFVDPKNLRYTPYWQRWVNNRPDTVKEKIQLLHNVVIVFVYNSIISQHCLNTYFLTGTKSAQQTV